MTTVIADAKAGVMASDSHWTDGSELGPCRKVWRINGALVGFAGSLVDIPPLRDWIRKGMQGKPPAVDTTALILSDKGVEVWTRVDGLCPVPDQWAIGTGGKAARAAMMAGATPARALAIAKLIDSATSGPTRVYRLRKATT